MYVVAYDIGNDRERTRVVRVVEQYCRRVQKSVWVSDMGGAHIRRLKERLDGLGISTGVVDIWESPGVPVRMGEDGAFPEPEPCHVV